MTDFIQHSKFLVTLQDFRLSAFALGDVSADALYAACFPVLIGEPCAEFQREALLRLGNDIQLVNSWCATHLCFASSHCAGPAQMLRGYYLGNIHGKCLRRGIPCQALT